MRTTSLEKLASHLKPGHAYRRDMLLPYSKAIDRDLVALTANGTVQKLSGGLYYKPLTSRFGILPPNDEQLVKCFLRDDPFLLYSWHQYNSLGLGLTQLYNRVVVYNRKRHGVFTLGGREFDFRRPARGFASEVTPEFLLVDLVNNLKELAEDVTSVKDKIKDNLHHFDLKKVKLFAKKFGKVATRHYFESLGREYDIFTSITRC